MNKIHSLKKVSTHVRSFNIFRANATSMRYFSTEKDSGNETKDSISLESSGTEKESQAETNESAEASKSKTKLSGFAQSYEKFSHIDDKVPETLHTFASLIRHSKFVDVSISNLKCRMCTNDRAKHCHPLILF